MRKLLLVAKTLVTAAAYMRGGKSLNVVFIDRQRRPVIPAYTFVPQDGKTVEQSNRFTLMKASHKGISDYYNNLGHGTPEHTELSDLHSWFAYKAKHASADDIFSRIGELTAIPEIKKYIKITKDLDRKQLHKYVTIELKLPLDGFVQAFGAAPDMNVDEDETLSRVGKAVVYFPDRIKEANKKSIMDILEKVYSIFKKNRIGQLMTGDIRVQKMGGSTIGLYYPGSKDIRVNYMAKKSKMTLETIIHEFGHKWYHEFIPGKKTEIRDKYREARKQGTPNRGKSATREKLDAIKDSKEAKALGDLMSKPGVKLSYTGRKRSYKGDWETDGLDYRKWVRVKRVGDDGKSRFNGFSASPSYFLTDPGWTSPLAKLKNVLKKSADIKRDLHKEDDVGKNIDPKSWFPTKYSEKDSVEWYAEIFAYTLLDQLKGEPADFLKSTLKK